MAPPPAADRTILRKNAESVAHRPLPEVPQDTKEGTGSIVLFYQYKEPVWTKSEHRAALKRMLQMGHEHKITGRGRVAPEGVNCTLSCAHPQGLRDFCTALREWNPDLFEATDFKITDNVPPAQLFKSLSIRKTQELVAYGLEGAKAPSLQRFAGTHLPADAYHDALRDPDTVVVDVRNAYETALGRIQPPSDGAKLLDPQMRNSIEWSQWLNDPETKDQLSGKRVLMYCTGGIRCERATALLNQMAAVDNNDNDNDDDDQGKKKKLKPKGVYELQGGIERYIQTFPDGGYWKGKNYLFDRRMEQVPANKSPAQVEAETDSVCCQCRQKWTVYRGKFKCSREPCGVPVIVCDACKPAAAAHVAQNTSKLLCELCRSGYRAPQVRPDLVQLKRQAESATKTNANASSGQQQENSIATAPPTKMLKRTPVPNRLFISRLPLTVTKTKLAQWLNPKSTKNSSSNDGADIIQKLQWCVDANTGAFYGSCRVQLATATQADQSLARGLDTGSKKGRKPKIVRAWETDEPWPPAVNHYDGEYPPVGR